MEYHKRDLLHVMQFLGHRNIKNTLVYTQLVNFENDDYQFATASNVQEAVKLIEAGIRVCMYLHRHNALQKTQVNDYTKV